MVDWEDEDMAIERDENRPHSMNEYRTEISRKQSQRYIEEENAMREKPLRNR